MPIDTTSIDALRAATVYSSDGDKIGRVGDVYLGDHSDQPEWVTVKTGLFGTSESFVPLAEASLSGDEVRVPYSKDQVKDAPRTDADGQISEAEEDRLFDYYGLKGSSATGTTSTAGAAGLGGSDARHRGETGDLPYDQTTDQTSVQRRDLTGRAGVQGHDTSGPTTDDAMTRSEERLHVGTEVREAGRARLRKHIVTESQTAQVATSHEELTIEREPITEANRGAATSGAQLSEEEHEIVLHEEVPVVSKTVEPVERVRLGTQTEHDTQTVARRCAQGGDRARHRQHGDHRARRRRPARPAQLRHRDGSTREHYDGRRRHDPAAR
ncbi:DUF2382 domain-containing protein [Quadrisphaera sp. INWT6]|uniref:DUF2382 domain-containing protein n=1 Tax=Quadrisphaera sp. INWT6 TaxID=2596917 RepID=UPI0021027AE1|nr:PRC and DUF2382 domain-containing protein [Quadrisphaera sp. INWT6]